MQDQNTLANFVDFTARNIVENLKFIPEERYEWKPEVTAKSVHEIVAHIQGNFNLLLRNFGVEELPVATDVSSAKFALLKVAEEYGKSIRIASPEKMREEIEFGPVKTALGNIAAIAMMDLCHHHGQIVYLQTLWGDEETHFDFEAFGMIC